MSDYPLLMIPGPTNISSEVQLALAKPLIGHRTVEFKLLYESLVEKLKKLLYTKNIVIPLTSSGTGAIEAVMVSLFNRGEKIGIIRNGVFSDRAGLIAKRRGLQVKFLDYDWTRFPSKEEVYNFLEENKDITALYIVYNETSTGVAAKHIHDILAAAKEYDLLTVVDAISAVGGDYLYVDKWNIDVCIGGSQKALAAPPVISFISLSQMAIDKMNKVNIESFYFDLKEYLSWYYEKRETPSTPAIPLFYALNEALDKILNEGVENRVLRHIRASNAFYNSIEICGLELFANKDYRSNTVISIKLPHALRATDIVNEVYMRYNILIAPGMGKMRDYLLRIGCMGEISLQMIIKTITAICNVMISKGVKVDIYKAVETALEVFNRR